jgi:hypothetical protein
VLKAVVTPFPEYCTRAVELGTVTHTGCVFAGSLRCQLGVGAVEWQAAGMYLFIQTLIFVGVFVVLLTLNFAVARGNKDPRHVPIIFKLMPLFALGNGAWFGVEVWQSRPYNGFFVRGLWSVFSFGVACGGFVMLAAFVMSTLSTLFGRARAPQRDDPS